MQASLQAFKMSFKGHPMPVKSAVSDALQAPYQALFKARFTAPVGCAFKATSGTIQSTFQASFATSFPDPVKTPLRRLSGSPNAIYSSRRHATGDSCLIGVSVDSCLAGAP